MLSIIINDLLNKFNSEGDLLFLTTAYEQQFYGNDILDADDKNYIATLINELPMPRIENYYTTRRREFILQLKGHLSMADSVKEIIDLSETFKVGNNTYYLSNFIVDDVKQEPLGNDKVKVFYGVVRVGVAVPTFVVGNDVKIKIDNISVNVIRGAETFDKALISNVEFGENTSDINTGSEHIFTFTLDSNSKTNEIFTDIRNKTYNKIYEFEFNFVVMTNTVSLVLRRGVINWGADDSVITFSGVFERALDRTDILINDTPVKAIGFTPQLTVEPLVRVNSGITRVMAGNISRNYSFFLENDNSLIVNQLIDEFALHTNKIFTIKYYVNGKKLEAQTILINMIIPTSENPNAVINITLAEA